MRNRGSDRRDSRQAASRGSKQLHRSPKMSGGGALTGDRGSIPLTEAAIRGSEGCQLIGGARVGRRGNNLSVDGGAGTWAGDRDS
jgi:hypothetical protein